jgi:ribosome biogenesis protein MAK21
MGNQGNKRRGQVGKDSKAIHDGSVSRLYKPHTTLLITFPDGVETWYQYESSLRKEILKNAKSNHPACTGEQVSQYREMADDIYRREVQVFMDGGNKHEPWNNSTIRKGTLKDRIAAMSVSVSENPIHSFHAIDGLLQMACGSPQSGGLPNSRVAKLAAEALEDLFRQTLLPPDRKLTTLHQKLPPFVGSGGQTKILKTLSPRLLLLWRFEEMVKDKFGFFLKSYLSKTLHDGLEANKIGALKTASSLLRSVPEGEALILSLLVNKLGDPDKKLAAAASNELKLVLGEHPKMKGVIAREVQQLAHRPHLSSRALYNCITFLNQVKLERTESGNEKRASENSLPAELITTYFKFFKVAIESSKKSQDSGEPESKSRLLSALLVGVNRAQAYLSDKDRIIDEHVDELYRVVHHAPPAAATQALALLFHVEVGSPSRNSAIAIPSNKANSSSDRFYRALYSVLSRPDMISSGRHSTIFFNILYKSLKYDKKPSRVLAIAKSLLCTTLHCNSPSVAASIFVLNDVAALHQGLSAYLEALPAKDGGKIVLQPTIREPQAALSNTPENSRSDLNSLVNRPSAWELSLATHQYHPSVAKFAGTAGNITYDGNPLQDFSLATFLDKFAYRNPKSVAKRRKEGNNAVVRFTRPAKDQSILDQQSTGEHSLFFQRYFEERDKRVAVVPRKKDQDSAFDDAEHDFFDRAVRSTDSFSLYER